MVTPSIGTTAGALKLQCDEPRAVRLQREMHEVIHHAGAPDEVGIVLNIHRRFGIHLGLRLERPLLRFRDLLLQLADAGEILIQLFLVALSRARRRTAWLACSQCP